MQTRPRCIWATDDPLYINYHDKEWGVPIYDDQKLFEFLLLEGAQAGLSWITILKKRESYRLLFDNFDATKIVRYRDNKIQKLLVNPSIIRNRLKIHAAVQNAKSYLEVRDEFGSFSDFIWQFVDGKQIKNHWKNPQAVPVTTIISDKMSKELKKRGFKFVGSTICYAFMQAVGLVNDHITSCFRHNQIK